MPTAKPRINISTDPRLHKALEIAAKRDGVPLATKAAELLEVGLALEEDRLLAAAAEKRLSSKARFIAHEDAWL